MEVRVRCQGSMIQSLTRVESQQAHRNMLGEISMSRNFYILAGSFLLFALLAGGMTLIPSNFQPGLPANGTLWRTIALLFLVLALVSAFIGVMTNLFEQVDRHSEESRQAMRRRRRRNRDS